MQCVHRENGEQRCYFSLCGLGQLLVSELENKNFQANLETLVRTQRVVLRTFTAILELKNVQENEINT